MTLAINLVVFVSVFSILGFSITRIRNQYAHEMESQAFLLLDALEISIGDALYRLDVDYMSDLMEALGIREEILSSGRIYNSEGHVLVDSQSLTGSYSLDQDGFGRSLLESSEEIIQWGDEELLMGRALTAGNQVLGAISVGLPTASLNRKVLRMHNTGLLVGVFMAIAGGLLGLVLARSVTIPLKAIVRTTRDVSEGDLGQGVEINAGIEFSQLADSFNHMIEQVRHSRDELETRVHERTADLESALEDAKRANKAKSDFLAHMSHELRTPLNHIIGFTELVHEERVGKLNETQTEYLSDALDSSHHLLSLINDVLDLSKIEAGRLELLPGDVDPASLIETCVRMTREQAMTKNIEIRLQLQTIPARIEADERKVTQTLLNLLDNALKFTTDGGEITVTAHTHWNGHGPELWIEVNDSGSGLEQEDLERIFRPFEQAGGIGGRHHPGTGLGLALSREFIELHGGRLWASSEGTQAGSTFTIALPV
jgi:signal transduction histidine kinase